MAAAQKHKVLYIVLSFFLIIIGGAIGYGVWLSHHYKSVIAANLPGMITKSTDSIYHVSYGDINVSIFSHEVTITDFKLTPDEAQVKAMRSNHRHVPPTLSTVSIASLQATGIAWEDILAKKTLGCQDVTVHGLKWLLNCHPHPEDSLFTRDKRGNPKIARVAIANVHVADPDVTYHYTGSREHFYCYMKGGTAELKDWSYNCDEKSDTTTFLFAHSGKLRLASLTFVKSAGTYTVKHPDVDFESDPDEVLLKQVKFKNMEYLDAKTKKQKEIYNLSFPSVAMVHFNWYQLINHGELQVPKVNAEEPDINIKYIRENATNDGRKGDYPNQLLLQVGLTTNLEQINIKNGHFKYTEVTKKGDEGIIEFTGIRGRFDNVTNDPQVIAQHKSCNIKLHGKFMNKSDVDVTFGLSLANKKGGYKVDGVLTNLDGDEVNQQAQAFTVVKVTSFHLDKMDIHIEGDETYGKGNFTVLYHDLKISLLKFDTKMREGKKGLFSFVGDALLLYPDNPMKDKDPRTVTTSLARDTTKGFISTLWQHIFRAAKKTAVKEQGLVTLTDGPETNKGEEPKKGFFKRLFKKKNK